MPNYAAHSAQGLVLPRDYGKYEVYQPGRVSATVTGTPRPALNRRVLDQLTSMAALPDNWDGDDAPAPAPAAVQRARGVVELLSKNGTDVFNAAPGPNGEVSVELRRDGHSVELLFYHTRSVYVTLADDAAPQQGEFSLAILPGLLRWLKMK